MSTEFMPSKRIAFERIRTFNHNGVSVRLVDGKVFLSEGTNGMWAYPPCPGRRVTFVLQGCNESMPIIKALEDCFHVRIVSEYEDEFFAIIKTERSLARRKRRIKHQGVNTARKGTQ